MNEKIVKLFADYIKERPREFPKVRICYVAQYPDGLTVCQLGCGDYDGGIILYENGKFDRFGLCDKNLAKRIGNRSLDDLTFLYNEKESS